MCEQWKLWCLQARQGRAKNVVLFRCNLLTDDSKSHILVTNSINGCSKELEYAAEWSRDLVILQSARFPIRQRRVKSDTWVIAVRGITWAHYLSCCNSLHNIWIISNWSSWTWYKKLFLYRCGYHVWCISVSL